jgi:radical SAM/Cys-rich protein
MVPLTLLRQDSPLAQAETQREILERRSELPTFSELLQRSRLPPLRAVGVEILQINLGKLCNQTCRHCHVDAGPDRREIMSREMAAACIDVLRSTNIGTLDLTGGAPEMNPNFRWLVEQARGLGRRIIDRCNLTILLAPGFDDLPEFLAEHRVEIVASLPCYLAENADRQRGDGVFDKSIAAIRRLNELGYGQPDTGLTLNLVYNPMGASLPPPQDALEQDYHRELRSRYGVVFNRLFTITNMPISRFLADLLESGRYEAYLQKLVNAFNPASVAGVMCRTTLSVDWRGRLFDCDFNQMLDLEVEPRMPRTIHEFRADLLAGRNIVTGRHCFGCTAGAGSSCQGSIVQA